MELRGYDVAREGVDRALRFGPSCPRIGVRGRPVGHFPVNEENLLGGVAYLLWLTAFAGPIC